MRQDLHYEDDFFSCSVEKEIALFFMKTHALEIATHLDVKERLFKLIHQAEQSPEIKVLLMLNAPDSFTEKEYGEFMHRVFSEVGTKKSSEVLLSREEHAISQFIMKIAQCPKVVVAGLQGRLAAPFFGVSLAFDYRLVSEDLVFELSYADLGVPPGGGLGFFLPLYVGMSKAIEIVLSGSPIPAYQALEMGLVNAVLPVDQFKEECVERIEQLIHISLDMVSPTKELLRSYREEDLDQYLDKECHIISNAWRISSYRDS